jgi:hypothetical protein
MLDRAEPVVFERLPRLRRGLFGVRRKDVLRELEERDSLTEASRKRAQTASGELEQLRRRLGELETELEQARHQLSQPQAAEAHDPTPVEKEHSKFCDCVPSDSLLEEMTRVVSMTEESTQRILEHARVTLLRDIDAAEALREQARSEIAQAVAWRTHWAPVLKVFRETIRETQGAIDQIPERIRGALSPLTAAAAALDHELLQFAGFGDGIVDSEDDAEPMADEAADAHGEPVIVQEADERTIVLSDPDAAESERPNDGEAGEAADVADAAVTAS